MWLRSTWTDAFATAASFSRRHSRSFVQQASPLLFRCACSPRLYRQQAPHLVGLFCWSGLSGWSGLSDWFGLSVGLFVGWSIGLVGLVSVVWGLLVSSVLFIGLGWRLVCLVGLVCLLLCL